MKTAIKIFLVVTVLTFMFIKVYVPLMTEDGNKTHNTENQIYQNKSIVKKNYNLDKQIFSNLNYKY